MNPTPKTAGAEADTQELRRHIGELTAHLGGEDSLIQALHIAQEAYGYLSPGVQWAVSESLGVPLATVSGVVSFYSYFTTQPRGRHVIRVCRGTACHVRGGRQVLERIGEILGIGVGETTPDRLFTLEAARCIGACGLAPAIAIDDVVYRQVHPDRLLSILNYYRKEPAGNVDQDRDQG